MFYQFGATATALVHLAFIVFVIAGGFAVVRWPKLAWIHLPAAIWGSLIEFAGLYCPLTTLENWFLSMAGRAGYGGGFIAHYILAVIYPQGLTRGMEIAIGVVVVAVNAGIYYRIFR